MYLHKHREYSIVHYTLSLSILNFSTRQRRWEWTSPLFFWDQGRVKWHITCPPSHLKFKSWIQDGGLQDGGRGTHVTHFVQLYPQPLYTASQVLTTSRSWDKGVLTDLCLTLYNIMGPPSYMRSVVDRNVAMRRVSVIEGRGTTLIVIAHVVHGTYSGGLSTAWLYGRLTLKALPVAPCSSSVSSKRPGNNSAGWCPVSTP